MIPRWVIGLWVFFIHLTNHIDIHTQMTRNKHIMYQIESNIFLIKNDKFTVRIFCVEWSCNRWLFPLLLHQISVDRKVFSARRQILPLSSAVIFSMCVCACSCSFVVISLSKSQRSLFASFFSSFTDLAGSFFLLFFLFLLLFPCSFALSFSFCRFLLSSTFKR